MTKHLELYLMVAGVHAGGELRFGGEHGSEGVRVAEVSTDGTAWSAVDVSRQVHAGRVTAASAGGAGRYVLTAKSEG